MLPVKCVIHFGSLEGEQEAVALSAQLSQCYQICNSFDRLPKLRTNHQLIVRFERQKKAAGIFGYDAARTRMLTRFRGHKLNVSTR